MPSARIILFLAAVSTTSVESAPTHLVPEAAVSIKKISPGLHLVDFGRVSFGNIKLNPPAEAGGVLTVHFGEAFKDGRIDRTPPGTVRYNVSVTELEGSKPLLVAPSPNKQNTKKTNDAHPPAILTPVEWGVILPFRWVEIEGWLGDLSTENIFRQSAYSAAWNDDAASFSSSDQTLNDIWELCRYSIKATTFAGVYVDGDRERIPYEADAYLNQLSHYYTDNDSLFARDTYDRLIDFATWPTEWAPHMIFIAHADWMRNGDKEWLAPRYERLKTKTLIERSGSDGLIISTPAQIKHGDIVDWPKTERDGYVFTGKNTVVNAFHLVAIRKMAELADALGKDEDARQFKARYDATLLQFNQTFLSPEEGIYCDGESTNHSSHHANFFPLAFGLVPEDHRDAVLGFLKSKGMDCSVYAAHYLLEALFENGAADKALALIAADTDRSWKHMLNSGTTITWEAWDQKYKPNQDWNHAWGAAPANLFPRYLLGVQAAEPGWKTASIRPFIGTLKHASGKIPTPCGPITIGWENRDTFSLKLDLPEGMKANLDLPAAQDSNSVTVNDRKVEAIRSGDRWIVREPVIGSIRIVVQ